MCIRDRPKGPIYNLIDPIIYPKKHTVANDMMLKGVAGVSLNPDILLAASMSFIYLFLSSSTSNLNITFKKFTANITIMTPNGYPTAEPIDVYKRQGK